MKKQQLLFWGQILLFIFFQQVLGQSTSYAQNLMAQNDTIFISSDALQNQQTVPISIFNNDQIDSLSFEFIDVTIFNTPIGYLYYDACFCDITYTNLFMPSGLFSDSFTYQIMGYAGGNYYYSSVATVLLLEDCTNNCVFPGDTDNNGVVNILDMLPIGLANGTTGQPRAYTLLPYDTLLAQLPQTALPWTDALSMDMNFSNGVNYKYADCNGDGIINTTDTLFVVLNYGQINPNASNTFTPALCSNEYEIHLDILNTSVAIGDTIVADIMLGNTSVDIYGMAFSITHNVVDSGTMKVNFPNSFLNDDGQIMFMQRRNTPDAVEAVVTRTNQQTRFGQGKVGTISFIMEDVLEGKTESEMLQLTIENVTLIGENNTYLSVPDILLNGDEAQITGVKPSTKPKANVSIYPNPASNYCIVDWKNEQQLVQKIVLTDINGKQLQTYLPQNNAQSVFIDTNNLSSGIYSLQIYTNKGLQISQLMITNFK